MHTMTIKHIRGKQLIKTFFDLISCPNQIKELLSSNCKIKISDTIKALTTLCIKNKKNSIPAKFSSTQHMELYYFKMANICYQFYGNIRQHFAVCRWRFHPDCIKRVNIIRLTWMLNQPTLKQLAFSARLLNSFPITTEQATNSENLILLNCH